MYTVDKDHSIGKTIAELRKKKGWTQAELAEKLQVSDKAVSKWEQDSGAPSIEFFPALATLFDVSIDYLMTGKKIEPEVVTISRAELCAKNDDVKLIDKIDYQFKDENGKNLIDYIVDYESYNVFVAFCEQANQNITNFNILDAIKFSILTNRLDLLRGTRFELKKGANIWWKFDDEKDLLRLLPKAIEDKFNSSVKSTCIFSNEFFGMIVCSERINSQTMDIILGAQKGRKCVWYHAFPFLIHQCYLHNKTELLEKLLSLSIENNEYAYKNIPLVWDNTYKCYNYPLNFFFIGCNKGHGLVRILEETIKLALERCDIENVEKFNSINSAIITYHDFKPYVASEYDIKMTKLKSDQTISEEELQIESTIQDGIVNIAMLLETKDLQFIKKVLDNYPIHPLEIPYKMFKNQEWRNLFEYAVDNNLPNLAENVLKNDLAKIEYILVGLFKSKLNSQGYPVVHGNAYVVKNKGPDINRVYYVAQIVEYFEEYKQQIIADLSVKLNKESLCVEKNKILEDLNKEYFEAELAKGNAEMVIVKLCVRLEAILRCRFEGDFSEMLNSFCSLFNTNNDEGNDYDPYTPRILNRLRIQRNSIVHFDKAKDTLSMDEIKFCIDYICKMN